MKYALLIFLAALSYGCSKPSEHSEALSSAHEREMTLGIVQKEIRKHMTQDEIASRLGSPNIVTKDSSGKESWIYDKIASEASYSEDQGGIWLLIAGYGKQSGAVSKTQKTLTVVIKFDDNSQVETVSYHSSKF
jgi:outer membrane protein assembly factor BamE (lipoprotein component of BamABCDE complex)